MCVCVYPNLYLVLYFQPYLKLSVLSNSEMKFIILSNLFFHSFYSVLKSMILSSQTTRSEPLVILGSSVLLCHLPPISKLSAGSQWFYLFRVWVFWTFLFTLLHCCIGLQPFCPDSDAFLFQPTITWLRDTSFSSPAWFFSPLFYLAAKVFQCISFAFSLKSNLLSWP